MVLRSYNNANANGGVAYANANNDSSNTNANIGSRLELVFIALYVLQRNAARVAAIP